MLTANENLSLSSSGRCWQGREVDRLRHMPGVTGPSYGYDCGQFDWGSTGGGDKRALYELGMGTWQV